MIITDTGFWIALCNKSDKYHKIAVSCLEKLNEGLVCTWPVMTETFYILANKLSHNSAQDFFSLYKNNFFSVFEINNSEKERISILLKKYEKLPMDLADASLVILAERLGHGRIFSTDKRDFNTYRWKENKPFENLLV